jgi:hypothetical protein
MTILLSTLSIVGICLEVTHTSSFNYVVALLAFGLRCWSLFNSLQWSMFHSAVLMIICLGIYSPREETLRQSGRTLFIFSPHLRHLSLELGDSSISPLSVFCTISSFIKKWAAYPRLSAKKVDRLIQKSKCFGCNTMPALQICSQCKYVSGR